mgnify:CR=1 FL=1
MLRLVQVQLVQVRFKLDSVWLCYDWPELIRFYQVRLG